MKYIVQNWEKENDGVLFCVQRLQEMLFHYSDDIVRAPVHNTQTLIDEYISVEKEVLNGRVKQYQLEAIMQELKESLLADKILKEEFDTLIIEDITNSLIQKKSSMVHYLSSIITRKKYYHDCVEYLKKNVVVSNHKKEIEFALRAWISSVVWYGYSPEYIYRHLRNLFDVEVEKPMERLEEFLNRFDFSKQNYKVYFAFSTKARSYQKLLGERLRISFEDDGNFKKLKKNPQAFVGSMKMDALDSNGAVQRAYLALNIFLKFYKTFTNKKDNLIGKSTLVINEHSKESLVLPMETQGYRNIEPKPGKTFAEEIDAVVLGCQSKEGKTYSQLNKIVDLHNAALKQQDLNDAFVNLWSAIEVVSLNSGEKSKIDSVIKSIGPVLQSDYYTTVFENINTDLKHNLSKEEYNNLLSEIDEECSDTQKIACFVLLNKYEKLREKTFENTLYLYPNIRNKIYNMYLNKDNKAALKNSAEKYRKRVCWHIYRLYRVRNAIVHAGESHKRIQVLGEHLHIYVDAIIMELLVKLATNEHLNSIEDVLIDTELLIKRKYDFSNNDYVEYSDIELLFKHCFTQ